MPSRILTQDCGARLKSFPNHCGNDGLDGWIMFLNGLSRDIATPLAKRSKNFFLEAARRYPFIEYLPVWVFYIQPEYAIHHAQNAP